MRYFGHFNPFLIDRLIDWLIDWLIEYVLNLVMVTQGHCNWYRSKAWYGFLFVFHSNYGSILYHFRDKVRYWSKIAIFSYHLHSTPPLRGPRRNIAISFGTYRKTRMVWLQVWRWEKFEDIWRYVLLFRQNTGVWRTDRRTDILRHHSPRYA